jgi:hypothetical protein
MLKLVVIRFRDAEQLASFYSALGLSFVRNFEAHKVELYEQGKSSCDGQSCQERHLGSE